MNKEVIHLSFLSLNSWSLHRSLGSPIIDWNLNPRRNGASSCSTLSLIDLPRQVAARGIQCLDVCHFHFEDTSGEYLAQLREAFENAGVTFYTLLVDYGDITHANPTTRMSHLDNIRRWIDIAAQVGAERVRVVAGESRADDKDALSLSASQFAHLMHVGQSHGVRIITENFKSLASTADNCLYLRRACQDLLGLIADFGNFAPEQKYDSLARILPVAENIHAKGHYDAQGQPDIPEFERCLTLLKTAQYNGPIAMVYDGPGDEWEGIARVQAVVEKYL